LTKDAAVNIAKEAEERERKGCKKKRYKGKRQIKDSPSRWSTIEGFAWSRRKGKERART
jgi:hypothetical protein